MSSIMNIKQSLKALILRRATRKRVMRSSNKSPENILFLRYDRIGDMVLTTPVFREYKKVYPNSKIYVLASKTNSEIIRFNPYIDQIFINHKHSFISDIPSLLKLRKLNIDIAVEFDHSVVPHAIMRLRIIKPKKIFSVRKSGRYGVPGKELLLYDKYSEKLKNEHARDVWLRTIESLTGEVANKNYEIFLNKESIEKAEKFTKQLGDSLYVGFNLKGAVRGKKIHFADFEKLANQIKRNSHEVKIILFSTPEEREKLKKRIDESKLTNVFISYPTFSVIDLCALIMRMNIVITPDTSVVHIASAFNIPIISIHEKNIDSYNLFRPQSTISRTVFSEASDSLNGFKIGEVMKFFKEIMVILGKKLL